jgi:dihydroorotate dehydrogenase electron transfer subunit
MQAQTESVLWNRTVGPDVYKLAITCAPDYERSDPGQFVMLRIGYRSDPLLRRPFSIHRLLEEEGRVIGLELLYKVVGRGTRRMTFLKPGDPIDALGPLGRGFSLPEKEGPVFVVAGGMGVAPLLFLVQRMKVEFGGITGCRVFLGGRSAADVLCREDFQGLGAIVQTTTDDGSLGDQCLVTHPVEAALEIHAPDAVFACGPAAMLGCVAEMADKHRIPCQVSVETSMACGVGACLGCVVESRLNPDAYLHACIDGPVFDSHRVRIPPDPATAGFKAQGALDDSTGAT